MRASIWLITLCSALASLSTSAAGVTTRLVVNCLPTTTLPAGNVCLSAIIGTPRPVYVIASDAVGNIVSSYTGTVHITSSDPTATLPSDHTFTAADAGVWSFNVTFNSVTTGKVPSEELITATDAVDSLSGSQLWSVFPRQTSVEATPLLGATSGFLLFGSLGLLGVGALIRRQSVR